MAQEFLFEWSRYRGKGKEGPRIDSGTLSPAEMEATWEEIGKTIGVVIDLYNRIETAGIIYPHR